MGFLQTLLSAMPGVGPVLSSLSTVMGGAAGSRAQGQTTEANLGVQQDQSATNRYQALVDAAMRRSQMQNVTQPDANMSQARAANNILTSTPVQISRPSLPYGTNTSGPIIPTITGGTSIGSNYRDTAQSVSDAALARQTGGNQIPGFPMGTGGSAMPSYDSMGITPLPKESALDKILGYGSLAGGIGGPLAGIIAELLKRRTPTDTSGDYDTGNSSSFPR